MTRTLLVLAIAAAAAGQDMLERRIETCLRDLEGFDAVKRLEAARRLRKMGPLAAGAARRLARRFGDQYENVRKEVIEAAVAIGPAIAPHLGPVMAGSSRRKAADALQVLARLEQPRLVAPHLALLVRALEDETMQTAAARALATYSELDQPLGKLESTCYKNLRHENPEVVRAMGLMMRRARPTWVSRLVRAFTDKRPEVRRAAATALAGMGADAVEPLMKALAATGSWRRRAGAAEALGKIGPEAKAAAAMLLGVYRDDEKEEVRAEAARALGRIGSHGEKAVPALIRGFADDTLRPTCVEAVGRFGATAAPFLLKQARSAQRAAVVRALSRTGAPLDAALASSDADVRLLAAEALAARGELAPLGRHLKDADVRVRRAAAVALAGGGRAEAAPVLLKALKDADPDTRRKAAAGLGQLGAAQAELKKALKDPHVAVRAAAAFGLWQTTRDGKAAFGPVRAAAKEGTWPEPVRALGRLGLAAAPAIPDLARCVARGDTLDVRLAAVASLRDLIRARGLVRSIGRPGPDAMKKPVREPVGRALAWLAQHQSRVDAKVPGADGRWNCAKYDGIAVYDLGVTALAVLAFQGAGHAPGKGPYGANIEEGISFLLAHQTPEGLFEGVDRDRKLLHHAIALWAVCEAYLMDGRAAYRAAAQRGLDYAAKARNPEKAWKYLPHSGKNTTHVTAWMVSALKLGELAGLRVDPAAFEGAMMWIEKMTDPNFGQVGYDYPGGAPARFKNFNEDFPQELTQSMTAAGCWCRFLLDDSDAKEELLRKGLALMEEVPPAWAPGRVDLVYWHFGALAMAQAGRWHMNWTPKLHAVLSAKQLPDGSWDPVGAWGSAGGRVYATAMGALALSAAHRYGRGFAHETAYLEPYDTGYRALVKAEKDRKAPRVAAAARRALADLEPR